MTESSACAALPPYLTDVIYAAGLRTEFRAGRRAHWDAALEQLPYIPVTYTNASIDYQLAYQQGHGGEWWDLSMIVLWDNKPSAIWPLSFSLKDGKGMLSSHGLPVMPPLIVPVCVGNSRKNIVKGCRDLVVAIANDCSPCI